MSQFKLYIYNDADLDNKIYPSGYIETIILDSDIHLTEYYLDGLKASIEQTENDGKKRINKITSFKEYKLEFIREVDFAMFISELKLHSNFTFLDHKGNTISPDQWDFEIEELSTDIDKNYRKITINIYKDFKTTRNYDSNYTLYSAPNSAPEARTLFVSGIPDVGNTVTINYVYYDADGDAEGTSTFQWFRYDDAGGGNKQVISGATSSTYVITTSEYNKYIGCRVIPVAATGTTPGTAVQSPLYACETNSAPEAQSVAKSAGVPRVGVEQTGTYVYYDADGDSEGATIEGWYLANDVYGAGSVLIASGSAYTPVIGDDYKFLAYAVTPIALTGIITGTQVFTNYQEIISA